MIAVEQAIAAYAKAYCEATAELNPYSDAEYLDLGAAYAVYCGVNAPIHGVYGLGLDNEVEERDIREIERFFLRKERAPNYYTTDQTHASLFDLFGNLDCLEKTAIHGQAVFEPASFDGTNTPDFTDWQQKFERCDSPLGAFTSLHLKDTRFYTNQTHASFSFFHQGIAVAPHSLNKMLCQKQIKDAKDFNCQYFVQLTGNEMPFMYERKKYGKI